MTRWRDEIEKFESKIWKKIGNGHITAAVAAANGDDDILVYIFWINLFFCDMYHDEQQQC